MEKLEDIKKKADPFKETNTAILYKYNSSIFKIINRDAWLYDEIIQNIINNYVLHESVSSNIILPTELVMDSKKKIRGYRCNYVPGNNLETFAHELSTEEKVLLLNRLLELLKEINKFLIVGDINLANCMYDKNGNVYMIDFDLSIPFSEEPSKIALYNFVQKKTNKSIQSNLSTDKLKMAILFASVLYETNFEASFISNIPYNKWHKFYQFTSNSYFKDYFKQAFKQLNHQQEVTNYLYLPNTQSFAKLIEEDKKRVRKLY